MADLTIQYAVLQWELILEKSLASPPHNVLHPLNQHRKDNNTIVVAKKFATTLFTVNVMLQQW